MCINLSVYNLTTYTKYVVLILFVFSITTLAIHQLFYPVSKTITKNFQLYIIYVYLHIKCVKKYY